MKTILILFTIICCIAQSSWAQRTNDAKAIKANKIRIVQTHSFPIVDGKITQNSLMTVLRKYDRKGKPTHTMLHSDGGSPYASYEYIYDATGDLCIGRNVYMPRSTRGIVNSSAFYYNIKGQHVKSVDSKPGQKNFAKRKLNYNKQKQLATIEFFENGQKQATQLYGYDTTGRINSSILQVETKQSPGQLIDDELIGTYVDMGDGHANLSFEEIFNEEQLSIRFTFTAHEEIRLLGADGMIDLKMGDQLLIEIEYGGNGLLKNKTQYLNGVLNAFVKFKYIASS